MNRKSILAVILLLFAAGVLLSCGGSSNSSQNCTPTSLTISPANGSADHTLMSPGNQVQYSGMEQYPPGCAVPAPLPVLTWTTSDTTNTSIGNGTSNPGLATCINATPAPATITGSLPDGSLKGTATLSCK